MVHAPRSASEPVLVVEGAQVMTAYACGRWVFDQASAHERCSFVVWRRLDHVERDRIATELVPAAIRMSRPRAHGDLLRSLLS